MVSPSLSVGIMKGFDDKINDKLVSLSGSATCGVGVEGNVVYDINKKAFEKSWNTLVKQEIGFDLNINYQSRHRKVFGW